MLSLFYLEYEMRVIVCGGRFYSNEVYLRKVLDFIHLVRPITVLIQGEAKGADSLAKKWATDNIVPVMSFPAQWLKYRLSAGHKRNKQMIDEGKPDMVIAFKGGTGTANMIEHAEKAGIPVLKMRK